MKKTVIVGAGAGGLYCAYLLARAGLKVLLLEAESAAGRKLAVSGGGHANFSNRHAGPDKYFCSGDDAFCKAALKKFSWRRAVKQVESWSLHYLEKDHGRLFLRESARDLVNILIKQCLNLGANIICGRQAEGMDCANRVIICQNEKLEADFIVLAQGAPAAGQVAGNGWAVDLAGMAGHTRRKFRPALVPLMYDVNSSELAIFSRLAGISLPVKLSLVSPQGRRSWRDDLLFTHKGLSGPAILNASLYWRRQAHLLLDFWPLGNFEKVLDDNPLQTPRSALCRLLPARLADSLLPVELSCEKNGRLARRRRKMLAACVHARIFKDLHPGGLEKAEVCAGGVNLAEIDPSSMASRICPNLYIIGEMLDVTGELGGYNLHWAWASAACATSDIISRCMQG